MPYDNNWRGQPFQNSYQNGSNASYGMVNMPYYPQNAGVSYTPTQIDSGMKWVDGEVGAKAFQLPQGWPPNTPYPLWDSNEPIIYFKSYNNAGMPNPLQRAHYSMDEQSKSQVFLPGQSGASASMSGNSDYATKDDINKLRDELIGAMTSNQGQRSGRPDNRNGGRSNEPAV